MPFRFVPWFCTSNLNNMDLLYHLLLATSVRIISMVDLFYKQLKFMNNQVILFYSKDYLKTIFVQTNLKDVF